MKKSYLMWGLGGLTFVAVLGTLLHFLYGWMGWLILKPFSAVNESTWEHMKILFFPMLIFAFIQYSFVKNDYNNFWCVKTLTILLGVVLIPIIFYTYNGALGKSPAWVDISSFFVSIGIAFAVESKLLNNTNFRCFKWLAVIVLVIVAFMFIAFTFSPPNLPIFIDPRILKTN